MSTQTVRIAGLATALVAVMAFTADIEREFSAPAAGDILTPGDSVTITWDHTGLKCSEERSYVQLRLYKDDEWLGYVTGKLSRNGFASCGSFRWFVPLHLEPGDGYVFDFREENFSSQDDYFGKSAAVSVAEHSPDLFWADAGDRIHVFWGSSGRFGWTFGGVADGFAVELLHDGDVARVLSENYMVRDTVIPRIDYFLRPYLTYTVKADSTLPSDSTYQLRIQSIAQPALCDTSKPFYMGLRPTYTITSIDSGDVFRLGDTVTIAWENAGAPSPTVSLRLSSGSVQIAESISNSGSYRWIVSDSLSTARRRTMLISGDRYGSHYSRTVCPPFAIDRPVHSLSFSSGALAGFGVAGENLNMQWEYEGLIDSLLLMEDDGENWRITDTIRCDGYHSLILDTYDRVRAWRFRLCEYREGYSECFEYPGTVTTVPRPTVCTPRTFETLHPAPSWRAIEGVDSFKVFCHTGYGTDLDTLIDSVITDTTVSFAHTLEPGEYYYLSVQSLYGEFERAITSTYFTVEAPLDIVCIENPTRNRKPRLIWNDLGKDVSYSYAWWMAGSQDTVRGDLQSGETSYTIGAALPAGNLFFSVLGHMQAKKRIHDTVIVRILEDTIPCPRPFWGKEIDPDSEPLNWQPVADVQSYQVELFDSLPGGSALAKTSKALAAPIHMEIVTDTLYAIPSWLDPDVYYWRVSSMPDYMNYSPLDSFVVASDSEDAVTIAKPREGSLRARVSGVRFSCSPGGGVRVAIVNASGGPTELKMYAASGRLVHHIVFGDRKGIHRTELQSRGGLPAGFYAARIQIGEMVVKKRFVLR